MLLRLSLLPASKKFKKRSVKRTKCFIVGDPRSSLISLQQFVPSNLFLMYFSDMFRNRGEILKKILCIITD